MDDHLIPGKKELIFSNLVFPILWHVFRLLPGRKQQCMKTRFTTLMLLMTLLLSAFKTQESNIEGVINALKSGSSSELSKYFDDNVELTLPDKSDSYSKAQAQQIVRDFFSNNGVRGFELKHKGDGPTGHYCVGTLQTNSGSFRTNVFMKMKNTKEVVKEIRFQPVD